MITDEELKVQGVRALIAALGDVEAERFVSLLRRAVSRSAKCNAGRSYVAATWTG
jgi:hypothetical protein